MPDPAWRGTAMPTASSRCHAGAAELKRVTDRPGGPPPASCAAAASITSSGGPQHVARVLQRPPRVRRRAAMTTVFSVRHGGAAELQRVAVWRTAARKLRSACRAACARGPRMPRAGSVSYRPRAGPTRPATTRVGRARTASRSERHASPPVFRTTSPRPSLRALPRAQRASLRAAWVPKGLLPALRRRRRCRCR